MEEKRETMVAADARRSVRELVPGGRQPLRLPRLPAGPAGHGLRVHLLALGDVGANLLLGLKLLGGGTIETIGIYDVNESVMARYEIEMNQIGWPPGEGGQLPWVVKLREEELFACDMFIFCASKAVPAIGATGDVRMAQFSANRKIVEHYAAMAGAAGFSGIFAVVSDPVDPLCKAALRASGLRPGQVRGYGLGVMHRRAAYFARKDAQFARYLTEGRAYGPHGGDLVIADSIAHYDDAASRALTKLTVEANLQVRALGFKPYLAPALSSGAMSLILTLQGRWHYSSVYFGRGDAGAFLGIRNRLRLADTDDEAKECGRAGVQEIEPFDGAAAQVGAAQATGEVWRDEVRQRGADAEAGVQEAEERDSAAMQAGAVQMSGEVWRDDARKRGAGKHGEGESSTGPEAPIGVEVEDVPLPEALYARIELAYRHLCEII